jgi:hypothetical protein
MLMLMYTIRMTVTIMQFRLIIYMLITQIVPTYNFTAERPSDTWMY